MARNQQEIRRKLRILGHAAALGDVSKTCRYFGIGRVSSGSAFGASPNTPVVPSCVQRLATSSRSIIRADGIGSTAGTGIGLMQSDAFTMTDQPTESILVRLDSKIGRAQLRDALGLLSYWIKQVLTPPRIRGKRSL